VTCASCGTFLEFVFDSDTFSKLLIENWSGLSRSFNEQMLMATERKRRKWNAACVGD
jgi:predicted protein tyrosine phosphatase